MVALKLKKIPYAMPYLKTTYLNLKSTYIYIYIYIYLYVYI